jgi:two-component system, NtrC family, sensor kinase
MKLSHKLTVAITLGMTAVAAGFGYTRVTRETRLFHTDAARDDGNLGRALAIAASAVADRRGVDQALELISDANVRESRILIRWVPGGPRPVVLPNGETDWAASIRSRAVDDPASEGDWLVTEVPVVLAGATPGHIELRESMAPGESYIRTTVVRTVQGIVASVALSALLIAVLIWVFVGRPMRVLMDKLRRIGEGDLKGPVEFKQRDEIGALAQEINRMCVQLETAREAVDREAAARLDVLEQLRHADRLATVGLLASTFAHELGTPLNVVLARARMIEHGEVEGEGVTKSARGIVQQVERMAATVRNVLDFARRGDGRSECEDLRALARAALELLEPLARKANVRLELEPGKGQVPVAADPGKIQQVLTNLVMNAIQSQGAGGVARISVERSEEPDGERKARLVIADEGAGIEPDQLAHIFEPFFTTKPAGQGTGLGLSVVQGIVRDLGGRIDVRSQPGEGTVFTIDLPLRSEPCQS